MLYDLKKKYSTLSRWSGPKLFHFLLVFTLLYRVWTSIVIVHEKSEFFPSYFQNISKTAETFLIKKNWAKSRHFGLQKRSNK